MNWANREGWRTRQVWITISVPCFTLPSCFILNGIPWEETFILISDDAANNVVICDVVVKACCSLSLPFFTTTNFTIYTNHSTIQPSRPSRPSVLPSATAHAFAPYLSTNQDWLRTGKRPGAGIGVQRSTEVVPTMVSSLATPAAARSMLKQNSKDSDGSVSSEGSK